MLLHSVNNFFHNEGFFMNTFRMISRVLVATAVVFVSGVSAMEKLDGTTKPWRQFGQETGVEFNKVFYDNKGIFVAKALTTYACGKNDHKKRVIIHMSGKLYDNLSPLLYSKQPVTLWDIAINGGLAVVYGGGDYALVAGEDYFDREKKIENVEQTINEKVSSYVAPVVGFGLRVITDPQAILFAFGSVASSYMKK